MRRLFTLSSAFVVLFTFSACAADVPHLAPVEAAQRAAAGTAVLVDVREPDEWVETGVVVGAATLALSDLRGERLAWAPFLKTHREHEIILYCRSGNRSGQAARLLAAEGFRVANAGGLRDWLAAGQKVAPPQLKSP
ncbi:MAG: rhodanese-like domain-containing protein [Opitutaceae bacterium]|nr:rhodanese-like domain-containing protein [Opitutaceae bacterium]